MLALLAPVAAHARPAFLPPGEGFGFNANLYPVNEPGGVVSQRTLDAAQAAGATHMRIGIVWRFYENESNVLSPVPTSFSNPVGAPTSNAQTKRADDQYLAIVNRGMTPILLIHSAPYWASHFHPCLTNPVLALDSTKCPPDWRTNANVLYAAADRFPALKSFAAAVARRYPLAIIEGTNEPDYQQSVQARYHPPINTVADAQCALRDGVRSVDPTRPILSSGLYLFGYAKQYMARLKGRGCYDAFSLHISGSSEVRAGYASGVQARLQELRYYLNQYPAPSKRIWLTETGLSDTFTIHNETDTLGEPLVATAFPRWVTTLISEPDIDLVLIHTIRENTTGDEIGPRIGFGQLREDYSVKVPGGGIMPRMCWLVLQNSSTWPGCEGWALTQPPPSPPSFFKLPDLSWPDDPSQPERVARALFLEQGEPFPSVTVVWYRCNALGLGCKAVLWNNSAYKLTSADRYSTLKAVVYLHNVHGGATAWTVLSPVVT